MAQPPPPPPSKPRVLCVEDDPALLKMLATMLEPIAKVSTATDGQEALDILQGGGRAPQLVITDVMMPRMDGLTLAKTMKKSPELSRIPVIMLTAKGGALDVVAGINSGARHYLTKPFKRDELLDKARRLLGVK